MNFTLKKYTTYIVSFFVVLACFVVMSHSAYANETIKNFNVSLVAQQDGIMNVSEKIVYDFGYGYRHGIYRFIPTVATVGNLYRDIKVNFIAVTRDGVNEPYSTNESGSEVRVKIGRAQETITGVHEYEIRYTVQNGIGSNYADHDEIYWNATGNSWQVPIENASISIATDFGIVSKKTMCFTGINTSNQTNCIVNATDKFVTVSATSPLGLNEGLTIVAAFPVNTFPKSVLQTRQPEDPDYIILKDILTIQFIFGNFFIAPILLFWYVSTKDKKRFGKPVVQFDIPKDPKGDRISPASAGTIDNARLDENDIVATMYDLAIRKYILIEQIKVKGKLFGIGGSDEYKLTKLKNVNSLNKFEQALVKALFGESKSTNLNDTSISYSDFSQLEKDNFEYLIDSQMYSKNPRTQMNILLITGVVLFISGGLLLGPILIFLSRKLNGRTKLGDEIDYKIDGLKIFLKATDRYTTWQAKNLLFLEKMIPYAIALGFIDEFMEHIKLIDPDYSPSWYRGKNNFFLSYHALSSSVSSHITTSAPSSSSGFSGGSSGGGGGGGGGGSW